MDEFDRTYSHAGGNGSASGNEKLSTFSPANVPHNLRPSSLNAPKDMYWFAHTGESSQGNGSEGEGSPVRHANGEDPVAQNFSSASLATDAAAGGFSSDSTKTTPMGRGALSPGHSESKDETLTSAQRDHEQRLRHYKELQEEDRLRKLTELQSASQQAQRFREQQEEDRRRKIDELRNKDLERRQAVEERKRLIWEAEQERKEAILRRNLERDAKIEAKRNAHRNTMSVAFGSSTPREIDLPQASASGMTSSRGSAYGSMMALSSVCHPAELFKKRTPSADVLDKKSDLSPSNYENSTPPGVQMQIRDSEFLSSQYPRRSFAGMSSEATRACLTIPETPPSHTHTSSSLQAPTDSHDSISDVWLFGSGVSDPMTRSLVILPSNRGRRKTDLTPTIPWERDLSLRSQSPGNIAGGRSQAKRAVSMSRLDVLAQPRRRPSAHLDQPTQGVPTTAAVNSSKGLHKDLHSPNRPRSSQSMASEQSVASTVSMRSHSGPRRARPFSIAGSIIPINPEAGHVHHPLPPQRRSRTAERKVPVVPPTRPPRAKSAGPDAQVAGSTPKAAAKKPPVAPKNGVTTANLNTEPTPPETVDEASGVPSDQTLSPEMVTQEPTSTEPKEHVLETVPLPNSESPQSTAAAVKTEELKESVMTASGKTPRITSEEEAKAALAEKRRLAREQAEREAELERQRQEELRRLEEERLRAEEEEQKRMEEEQLRLAEELRKQEEEKLQKAIQEQQKREEEEKTRKEEENKLRLEKEEQERKQREEAERQRKELEEKLKQEESARAERKKRVEQIMKRTRTKNEGAQRSDEIERPSNSVDSEASVTDTYTSPPTSEVEMSESVSEPVNKADVLSLEENTVSENSEDVERMNGLNKIVDSEVKVTEPTELSATQNRFQADFVDSSDGVVEKSNGTVNPEEVFAQTNGYSSHDVSLSEISPEEKTQQDLFTLLDLTPEGGSADSQRNQSPPPPPLEFDQLIDLSLGMTNQNEVNRLNNADELNSNRVPSIPFIAFEENVTRKQESTITDLLS